jgi:hypothetical protein
MGVAGVSSAVHAAAASLHGEHAKTLEHALHDAATHLRNEQQAAAYNAASAAAGVPAAAAAPSPGVRQSFNVAIDAGCSLGPFYSPRMVVLAAAASRDATAAHGGAGVAPAQLAVETANVLIARIAIATLGSHLVAARLLADANPTLDPTIFYVSDGARWHGKGDHDDPPDQLPLQPAAAGAGAPARASDALVPHTGLTVGRLLRRVVLARAWLHRRAGAGTPLESLYQQLPRSVTMVEVVTTGEADPGTFSAFPTATADVVGFYRHGAPAPAQLYDPRRLLGTVIVAADSDVVLTLNALMALSLDPVRHVVLLRRRDAARYSRVTAAVCIG